MPESKFSAVIFDMDGVIIDSEPRHERAFMDVFEQMGYGQTHGIQFEHYLGRSDRAVWVDFIAKHNPKWTLDELTAWKQNHLIEIIRREQPIFDGLPELVAKVAALYPMAVASGSVHRVIEEVLAMKSLRRFFPVVVSVQDVAHGKPAPDIFLRAAALLGVEPTRCCVIEDSAAGVTAARAAGMTAIAITNTLPAEKLTHAHHVVRTYEEIERLLLPV
ncbi:MAG: HAD family phosphatase [Verrucomicrobia bacterium]|nr:HAD family phosphatase [Verrucomicrobiota bacterium]NBU10848.1 HAD family phosphatase [Pseudomonadota bacterium]NDA67930.1 HAD family phosphatase [Verrucomicrobiota bacterium]NDB76644.1 HAD family phosphatase [Verrucomicrobiota bacterium]NDD39705.1 HAD family phosphatase [Verrucomicrobiota bacterium]